MFQSNKLWTIIAAAFFFTIPIQVSAQSEADCAARADRATRDSSGVGGGIVGGAARGAVFGVIVGDNRKAAKRGAVLGGVVGGANRNNQTYKRVYDDCMAGR